MKNKWRLPSRLTGVLVLVLAVVVPIVADTGRPAAAAPRMCFDSPPTTTAQFQQLADVRNTTWAVGDLTSIVDLPDGRRLFFFGDSAYYDLNGDGSRGPFAGFSSTSAWLQTGGCFTLLNTDGAYGRSWLEPPEQDGSVYWPGGATVVGNRLHVFLTRVVLERPWGRAVGSAVATFELPSLELARIANVPFHPERVLGSGAVYDNGYLYSYGSQLPGCAFCFAGDVFLGRVPEDLVSVPSAWEFYANGGWTSTHAAATPVLARAASQTHVQPWRNGFLLVTKSFSIVGPDVQAWWAPTPVGPWTDLGTIYKVPAAVSHVPGHTLVDPYTYMVSVSASTPVENGGVLLAYNVNSLHEPDVQRDGRLYGPRFVSVQLPAPPSAATRSNPEPAVSAWEPIVTVDSIGRVHAAGGNTSTSASYTRSAVGVARTPTGKGNWAVARDGGVFSAGDAQFYGSTGGMRLNQPVVGIAATPTGRGYWLVAEDGGVFSFGDAQFYGSTGSLKLNRPILGMTPTATGRGYWLVARDGGVFAFGDAKFYGSTGAEPPVWPVVDIVATPSGRGYYMVTMDGATYAFGDARFSGNSPYPPAAAITGLSPVPGGYRMVDASGNVLHFGGSRGAAKVPTDVYTKIVGVA
jgi:hypothetical protein